MTEFWKRVFGVSEPVHEACRDAHKAQLTLIQVLQDEQVKTGLDKAVEGAVGKEKNA